MALQKRPLERTDSIPMRDVSETRIVILSYNPVTDSVEVDAEGLSSLEVRGIVELAWDWAFAVVE